MTQFSLSLAKNHCKYLILILTSNHCKLNKPHTVWLILYESFIWLIKYESYCEGDDIIGYSNDIDLLGTYGQFNQLEPSL